MSVSGVACSTPWLDAADATFHFADPNRELLPPRGVKAKWLDADVHKVASVLSAPIEITARSTVPLQRFRAILQGLEEATLGKFGAEGVELMVVRG